MGSFNPGGAALSFVPPAPGATTRTYQQRAIEILRVTDYRARSDVDDTQAFVRASAVAASLGRGLYVPPGNYTVQPWICAPGLKALYGLNRGNTLITVVPAAYANGARMLDMRGLSKCDIYGLTLVLDNALFFDGTLGVFGFDLSGGTDVTLDEFEIIGSANLGVCAMGGSDIQVRNGRIETTHNGFHVGAYMNIGAGASMRDGRVQNLRLSGGFDFGVQCGGDQAQVSDGHEIVDCKGLFTPGRTIFGFTLVGVNTSKIETCYAEETLHEAFQLSDCNYCDIVDNKGIWTGVNGVDFGCSIQGTTVSRFNKIVANTLINSAMEGIAAADNSQDNLVEGNIGKDCGVRAGRGALIAYTVTPGASCGQNVFQNNQFINEAGPLTNYALESQSGAGAAVDFTVWKDNVFRGVVTGAPYLIVGASSEVWDPEWLGYIPVVTAAIGAFGGVNVISAQYRRRGKEISVQLDIVITAIGTALGAVNVTLPIASVANGGALVGREVAVTGKAIGGGVGGAFVPLVFYDNTFPGVTGARLVVSGLYRTP